MAFFSMSRLPDGLGREYEIIKGSNGSMDSTVTLGTDRRRFPHVPT